MTETQAPLLSVHGLAKRFGPVVANQDISFAIGRGEVVALVGENGAGKSTLVNLLSGLHQPDEGRIELDGEPVAFASPAAALAAGVGVVHQHYTLVGKLTALDNIALGMPELGLGRLDRAALAERAGAIARSLGFELALDARVDSLDVAAQQRIEILKALIRKVRLLLLDEPTAVLGPEDKENLFAMVRRLQADGVSVMLVTHKLDDIFAVCDRAIVLRGGTLVADSPTAVLSHQAIIGAMIGTRDPALAAEVEAARSEGRGGRSAGSVVCSLEDVTLRRRNGSIAVAGLSAEIRAGEIVAVAGVDGNGQSELVRCLAGAELPASGRIDLLGLSTSGSAWTPRELRRAGVSHIAEDRRRTAIVESLDLADNYLLGDVEDPDYWRGGFIRYRDLITRVRDHIAGFSIKATGPRQRIGRLSGGNQQKFVVARELDKEPKLLLAAHPCRGLDVRTTHFVHEKLREERGKGTAVLLVSADLDEVLALADRILVLAAGRAFGPIPRAGASVAELGAFIAGRAAA